MYILLISTSPCELTACYFLKPEGNLFRDRFLSFQHRALLEPRMPVLYVFVHSGDGFNLNLVSDPNGEEPRSKNTKSTLGRSSIEISRFSIIMYIQFPSIL